MFAVQALCQQWHRLIEKLGWYTREECGPGAESRTPIKDCIGSLFHIRRGGGINLCVSTMAIVKHQYVRFTRCRRAQFNVIELEQALRLENKESSGKMISAPRFRRFGHAVDAA